MGTKKYRVVQGFSRHTLPDSGERVLAEFASLAEAKAYATAHPATTVPDEFWGEVVGTERLEAAEVHEVIYIFK